MLNGDQMHLFVLELRYCVFMQLPQKRDFPTCVVFKYFLVHNLIMLLTKENHFIAERHILEILCLTRGLALH